MNRSFLLVILPPIAVFIGWVWLFRHFHLAIQPFQFIVAAVVIAAVIFVFWRDRRKSSRNR